MWHVGSTLIHILSIIRSEILESKCTHVVQVVDPASDHFIGINSDKYTSSVLILSLPVALNRSSEFHYVPTLHFCRICSLILTDVTNLASTFSRENSSEPLGQELAWPEYRFPGYPHHDYHVFTYVAESFDEIREPEQRILARLTRRIQNAFFMLMNESSFEVFRASSSGQNLRLISEVNQKELENFGGEGRYNVNYNGTHLTTITCPFCGQPYLELFEATGKWYNAYEAIVYDAFKSVNATILFQVATAVTRMKPDKDGDWDEWVAPLADESAAVASFQPMSVARLRDFHYPMAYLNDHVAFITAPPRRLTATRNYFARFMSPLTKEVWVCLAAAIVGLFVVMETTTHFHQWTVGGMQTADHTDRQDSLNENSKLPSSTTCVQKQFTSHCTLGELLKPLVYQGGNDQAFKAVTHNYLQAKCLLALWLLAIIVLGSSCQSAMKSRIVAPEYSIPPKTFRELANSHFGLHAIFWTEQILERFSESGLDYREKLVESVIEFDYLDPDVSCRPKNNANTNCGTIHLGCCTLVGSSTEVMNISCIISVLRHYSHW